jgi:5-formyltetrahydrofolate cyclo-ligase
MVDLKSELEPDELAALVDQAKRHLRRRMRALRVALPEEAWAARNARVLQRLCSLPEILNARRVALFAAIHARREVDLAGLDAELRARDTSVYYPFMEPAGDVYRTGFRPTPSLRALVSRGRGFREPDPKERPAQPGELHIVVVPALAVAPGGQRLGYGAGFYDSTLPELCPPARSIAVAFDFQLLGELLQAPWDVPCDIVVTESQVLRVATRG